MTYIRSVNEKDKYDYLNLQITMYYKDECCVLHRGGPGSLPTAQEMPEQSMHTEEATAALEETLRIDPNHLEAGTRLDRIKNYFQKATAQKQDQGQAPTATSVLHDKPEIIVTP